MSLISPRQGDDAPVLRVTRLSKSFGETHALSNVDFELRRGEIRALIGGNGSGKSTFVKILAGVETPDPGSLIEVHDGTTHAHGLDPTTARHAGFRFVHQDGGVFDEFTVGENLALGQRYPTGRFGNIHWRSVTSRAAHTIERFDIDARPDDRLSDLRPATRTKIAIARALNDVDDHSPGVLVLDEPTTSLPNTEASALLDWLRGFAENGQAILFVSHRLDEVLGLASTISVFRDGRHVDTVQRTGLETRDLVHMIVGRELPPSLEHPAVRATDTPRLEVRGLTSGPLRSIDLTVHAGEVVGIAGLLGSGRTKLLRAIAGDVALESGDLLLDGAPCRPTSIGKAMELGIGYVPENRLVDAAFPDLTVSENLTMASTRAFAPHGHLDVALERATARELVQKYDVRCGSTEHAFGTLSGGNQQKVVIARWLHRQPRLLLLDEPSQGVDVGARNDIENIIREHAASGMAVVVVTSDFDELARISDRVVVLRNGRAICELSGDQLSEELITDSTYGTPEERHVCA